MNKNRYYRSCGRCSSPAWIRYRVKLREINTSPLRYSWCRACYLKRGKQFINNFFTGTTRWIVEHEIIG